MTFPCVEDVILTMVPRGEGKDASDPCRNVAQVHHKDGTFIAENDPHHDFYVLKGKLVHASRLLRALREKHEALSDGDRERIDSFFDPDPL